MGFNLAFKGLKHLSERLGQNLLLNFPMLRFKIFEQLATRNSTWRCACSSAEVCRSDDEEGMSGIL